MFPVSTKNILHTNTQQWLQQKQNSLNNCYYLKKQKQIYFLNLLVLHKDKIFMNFMLPML